MIPGFSFLSVLTLSGCIGLSGQQPPPPVISGEIPQHMLFYQFFRMIAPVPGAPDMRSRLGSSRLSQVRKEAQLQDTEVELLQDVAADCVSKVAVVDEKAQTIIGFGRDRRMNPGGPPQELVPELKVLDEEKKKIIQQSLARLQESLGVGKFARIAIALKPQPGSSISASIPEDISKPAPQQNRIQRPDFQTPPRESLYESDLPIKVMISAVSADGLKPRASYKVNEPIAFKITVINTSNRIMRVNPQAALDQFIFSLMKDGERLKAVLRFAFLPIRGMEGEIQVPYNVPLEIGTARLVLEGMVLMPGQYRFTLQRPLVFQPPADDAETRRINNTALFALNSNAIQIEVVVP